MGSVVNTWTVVHFIADNTVAAVPTSWIISEDKSYWPPHSIAVSKASSNSYVPKKDWPIFDCKLFKNGTYDDYGYARKMAIRAEKDSDLSEGSIKNKRKRIPILRSSSEDELPSSGDEQSLPTPPSLLKTSSRSRNRPKVQTVHDQSQESFLKETFEKKGDDPVHGQVQKLNTLRISHSSCSTPKHNEAVRPNEVDVDNCHSDGQIVSLGASNNRNKTDFNSSKLPTVHQSEESLQEENFENYEELVYGQHPLRLNHSNCSTPKHNEAVRPNEVNVDSCHSDGQLTNNSSNNNRIKTGVMKQVIRRPAQTADPCHCCHHQMKIIESQAEIIRKFNMQRSIVAQVASDIEFIKDKLAERNQNFQTDEDDRQSIFAALNLPIVDLDSVDRLEEYLSNEADFKNAKMDIVKIGGTNPGDFIRRVMPRLMDDAVYKQFNWEGQKKKKAFNSLHLSKLLLSGLAVSQKLEDEKIGAGVIKNFLKNAAERMKQKAVKDANN